VFNLFISVLFCIFVIPYSFYFISCFVLLRLQSMVCEALISDTALYKHSHDYCLFLFIPCEIFIFVKCEVFVIFFFFRKLVLIFLSFVSYLFICFSKCYSYLLRLMMQTQSCYHKSYKNNES